MGTPDWKTNNSIDSGSIYSLDSVDCRTIKSDKSEFNILIVQDLSLFEPYSDISLTVANILKAKDISVDEIELENHIDTDGVIEFIKPIDVVNASIQEIRAYDGSFSSISVENKLVFSVIEAKTDNVITINSDASFYNNIQSNDICVNKISYRNDSIDQPIRFMCDVSINKSLYVEDISVSRIETFNNSDSVVFKSDVSMENILRASDFSAEILRAGDLSVNNISGSNNHIEFISDISNNTSILINEVSLNTLHGNNGKITIFNNLLVEENLKIGGELSLNNLYSENKYINFHDNTDSSYGIEQSDISIDIINPSEPPHNPDIESSNVLIINGDVSFNSTVDLDWVNSAFNVIPSYDSFNHILRKNSDFPVGSLVEIINTEQYTRGMAFVYIKVDDDSWHKLVASNNNPWYTQFTLSYEGFHMLLNPSFNQDILHIRKGEYIEYPPQSITDLSVGLQDYSDDTNFDTYNTIKFYVKKIKNEESNTYNLKIIVNDVELDNMTLRRRENDRVDAFEYTPASDISYMDSFKDFSYNYGAGWDVRLSSGILGINTDFQRGIENTDLSNLDIKVPINNGFDLSFILEVRDDATQTVNPKLIYITKVNEVPIWNQFKLDPSNTVIYSHKGTQLIDDPRKHIRTESAGMYNDISFDVSYDNPKNINNHDTSYYNLDLSAIDPEGFDVSYYIGTKIGDLNDWSWNWSADNSNMLKIKVPGARKNGFDLSLVILAHDNNIPDVSNLIPDDLYRNDAIETSYNRTFITFRKQNAQPIWEYIKLGVSNEAFNEELDQSWNTTSSESISGAGDLTNQFYLYFEPNKDYIVNETSQDLSSYFLDLSATDDGEGFDISFIVIKNRDISYSHVSVGANYDSSKIQIDISSLLTTSHHGFDTSLVLISQDDWYYDVSSMVGERVLDHSRNYNERILNFKHISSQILQDISYGYVDVNKSINEISYTNIENKYVAYYSKNNFQDMSLILHFNDDDLQVSFSDLSLTNKAFTNYDISLINRNGDLIIDISGLTEVDSENKGYTDISFDLLFKHVFKYKFLIENYYMSLGYGNFSDVSAENIKVLGDISTDSNGELVGGANLYVGGDASLNQNLYVVGDISADSNLYVGGDASLNQKLCVVGDISADANLYVGGDASLYQKLYVVGDISADANLYVGGDASLNQKLYVVGDISANANLYVGGDASLNQKLYVVGDISADSNLYVGGDASLNQKLCVVGDISANANLYVGGDASLNQNLYVVGDISADSNLYVGGDASLHQNLCVVGDISADANLYVGDDASLHQKLYVVGDISADRNLYVGGDVSLNKKLYVVGDISADANLYVGGDVSLNQNLYVAGDISSGIIWSSKDTDTTSYFGKAAVGYVGYADSVVFSHHDMASMTNYALAHGKYGATTVNCAVGKSIIFAADNSPKMVMESDGKVEIRESSTGTSATKNGGSLTIKHNSDASASSIVFPNELDTTDYGYIEYRDHYEEAGLSYSGSYQGNGVLVLGSENDHKGSSDHVRVKSRLVAENSSDASNAFQVKSGNVADDLFAVANNGNVGIGTNANPKYKLDVSSGNVMLRVMPFLETSGQLIFGHGDDETKECSSAIEVNSSDTAASNYMKLLVSDGTGDGHARKEVMTLRGDGNVEVFGDIIINGSMPATDTMATDASLQELESYVNNNTARRAYDSTVGGSNTKYGLYLPVGTTNQRPTSDLRAGTIRFNSTTSKLEFYDANGWVEVHSFIAITRAKMDDWFAAFRLNNTTGNAQMAAITDEYGEIENWDTSNIVDMSNLFNNLSYPYTTNFNENISSWDTSNVTNMSYMFHHATNFNQDISSWDTSKVTNMSHMFDLATNFDKDISSWDTSEVTDMSHMFYNATNFSKNINTVNTGVNGTTYWDTSKVTNMSHMFHLATNFDGDISDWDTNGVTNMSYMFTGASKFDSDISEWNTDNVTTMAYMFAAATDFNQDISGWQTGEVTTMAYMFFDAEAFYQNIRDWDVGKVIFSQSETIFGDAPTNGVGGHLMHANGAAHAQWVMQTTNQSYKFSRLGIANSYGWK